MAKKEKVIDLKQKVDKISDIHLDELQKIVNTINGLQFNIGKVEAQKHHLLHGLDEAQKGGFGGTTGGGMLTAGMAMGNAPLPTAGGGFNVQTEAAAQGVFGDPEQRQAAMGAAERLQESLNDPLTKSRKMKRKRLRSLESGMRGFGFVPGDIL